MKDLDLSMPPIKLENDFADMKLEDVRRQMRENRMIRVSENAHRLLKTEAAQLDITVKRVVDRLCAAYFNEKDSRRMPKTLKGLLRQVLQEKRKRRQGN